ncbi:MAG: DUF1893 domain-containing protein [Bacillota bacterium]
MATHSVALVRNGSVLSKKRGRGVRPLLEAVSEVGDVLGASLADRVVGVAVAKLSAYLGLRAVHGTLASEPAVQVLESAGVGISHDRLVPRILNRDRSGPCPIESMAIGALSPKELHERLRRLVMG